MTERVLVELTNNSEYQSDYEELNREDIVSMLDRLQAYAVAAGLEDSYFKMVSTIEPYEDYPGPVQLYVCGYRPPTAKEKEETLVQAETQTMATALGIPYYDACVLIKLEKRGKIKLGDTL
tara:strand:+ start:2038 stop:2400 length:363 start_codon:yes stop_codon:yes gene_type:complete